MVFIDGATHSVIIIAFINVFIVDNQVYYCGALGLSHETVKNNGVTRVLVLWYQNTS